jgi:hypothetical protein
MPTRLLFFSPQSYLPLNSQQSDSSLVNDSRPLVLSLVRRRNPAFSLLSLILCVGAAEPPWKFQLSPHHA